MSAKYRGPDEIGFAEFPGRGRSYYATFEGRKFQIGFSEKSRTFSVWVDGIEFVAKTEKEVTK